MTRPSTHIIRLLKWGRILARHGALRAIEADRNTPPQVKRLCRIARFGTIQPKLPDYAGAFRAIGPAAIKLGQTLATRPDIIGVEAAHNLLTLQDQLPPAPFDLVYAQIDTSLNKPAAELFEYIDPVPVGAASIAQVHRARTTEGKDVAVKVLRPGIREQFARDIETYEWAAAHLEALGGEAARLRPQLVIANLKRWTLRELDLRREAASASELKDAMVAVEGYTIPAIDWDRTSGRVLTLEWVDGVKISDIEALKAAGHDLNKMAEKLVLTFLRQAISEGYFHADMHQGNLFVRADGTIVAIDFGIMGRIDPRTRWLLRELVHALLVKKDHATAGKIVVMMGAVGTVKPEAQAAKDLEKFATPLTMTSLGDLSYAEIGKQLSTLADAYDVKLPRELVLIGKQFLYVERYMKLLAPRWQMMSDPQLTGYFANFMVEISREHSGTDERSREENPARDGVES